MGDRMGITAITAFATLLVAHGLSAAPQPVEETQSQEVLPADSFQTRVWLDRGDDPVVQRGDEVRVYYRTSADAYAAIFRIDTDGAIAMVFPQHPEADHRVVGARDYRLVFPGSPRWRVEEDPGVGYFFMVASPDPLDFSLLGFDRDDGWDLSGVGAVVYEDPYVAIDDYVVTVIPNWEVVPYALDFLSYSVGEAHEYPRFLCYDCHDFQSYSAWDPYAYECASYHVVVWNDPYFYPRYRYAGSRVVFARPLGPRPRYAMTVRLAGTGWGPIVRTRAAPPSRRAQYKEGVLRRSILSGPMHRPRDVGSVRPRASDRGEVRPTLQRRPTPAESPRGAAAGSRLPNRERGTTTRRPSGATRRGPGASAGSSAVRPSRGSRPTVSSPRPPRAPARIAPSPSRRRAPRSPAAGRGSSARPPSARGRPGPGPRAGSRGAPARRPTVRPSTRRPTRRGSGRPPRRRGG